MFDVFYIHSRQQLCNRYGDGIGTSPQSESLVRLMINIQYRTVEVLLSPFRGMEIKPKKCDRNSNA